MKEYNNFILDQDEGVLWVTLSSESPMNSMNETLVSELMTLSTSVIEDDSVRCIVIKGSNNVFSAGGNINSFYEDENKAAVDLRQGTANLHKAVLQLAEGETPVITGINGPAVGAGFSLALLGDIILMQKTTYLQYGYSGIGLTGDGSSTFFLPRFVGLQEAKRIALLNEEIYAEEAKKLGLVTEVVDPEEFHDRLAELATTVANGPTKALGRIANMINQSFSNELSNQLATESEQMVKTVRTRDYREGITAFRQNREPEFQGH